MRARVRYHGGTPAECAEIAHQRESLFASLLAMAAPFAICWLLLQVLP